MNSFKQIFHDKIFIFPGQVYTYKFLYKVTYFYFVNKNLKSEKIKTNYFSNIPNRNGPGNSMLLKTPKGYVGLIFHKINDKQ